MKKWLFLPVLFLTVFVTAVVFAEPKIPPAPASSYYVQDYAGVLSSETKARINSLGSVLRAKTKAQIVVVTVKSLEAEVPSDYARGILRQWGIGDRQLNNGVLFLLAIDDRKAVIEVGYGLEGALPDAKVGAIQDEQLLPYLKQGDYNQGVWRTYQSLAAVTAKEYNVDITAPDSKAQTKPSAANVAPVPWWGKLLIAAGLVGLALLDWVFFGGFLTGMLLRLLLFGRGGGGGSGGSGSGGDGGYGGGSSGGGGAGRDW